MGDLRASRKVALYWSMNKLQIKYVRRMPHGAEDLPPDVVELWVGTSGRKIDVNIVRRGFVLSDPVMHVIRERLQRVADSTREIDQPFAERVGFSPDLSPDWREFLDDLLQRADSWAFLVTGFMNGRPS